MKRWRQAGARLTRFDHPYGDSGGSDVWLPLVGAVYGAALTLLMRLSTALGGPKGGPIVAAIIIFGCDLWLTRGRRYTALIGFLERESPQSTEAVSVYVRIAVFQGALLLKFLSVAVLAAGGRAAWLIVAYGLAGMTAAECGAGKKASEHPPSDAQPMTWLAGGAVALMGGWLSGLPVAALSGAVVVWLTPLITVRLLDRGERFGEQWSAAMEEIVIQVVLALGAMIAFASV